MTPPSGQRPNGLGRTRWAMALGAVVVIMSVAEPLPVMDAELKLQELSNGSPEHTPAFSGIVPLKPFIGVIVSMTCPEPPGDSIVTVVGTNVMLKLGTGALTVTVTEEDVGEAE